MLSRNVILICTKARSINRLYHSIKNNQHRNMSCSLLLFAARGLIGVEFSEHCYLVLKYVRIYCVLWVIRIELHSIQIIRDTFYTNGIYFELTPLYFICMVL